MGEKFLELNFMKAGEIGLFITLCVFAYLGWIITDMSAAPTGSSSGSLSSVRISTVPVLVEFYADWCGPCKAIGPEVEKLAAELVGKAKVIRINIDESPGDASAYGVHAVPTFIAFQAGKEISRKSGGIPREQMRAMLGF